MQCCRRERPRAVLPDCRDRPTVELGAELLWVQEVLVWCGRAVEVSGVRAGGQRTPPAEWQHRVWMSSRWQRVRKTVLARDNYTCQQCGSQSTGPRSLHAHHLDPISESYPAGGFNPERL
jgi:hypothetical protein